jgi:hypothetical protein
MDYNKNNFQDFLYPFSFKAPWIYIFLCVAIVFYIYLFIFRHENEAFGVIERSIDTKILFVFLMSTASFFLFRGSPFIQQLNSIPLRGLLLLGIIVLVVILILPAWRFNKYDYEKINSYIRLLPFKNSPYIKTRETLLFNNIKTIKYDSGGGDSGGALRFIVNNGRNQSIEISNITSKSRDAFLVTLYEECNWLQDDIENQLGPIERRRVAIKSKIEKSHFNITHAIIFIFFIWLISLEIVCVIIYTFKIDL